MGRGRTMGMERRLRIVGEQDATTATGEAVLRGWANISAGYLTRRLEEISEADPLRDEIEALAARYVLLAAPASLLPT